MASFIYNSAIDDLANGNIDFGADTFNLLLVTSSYTANKDTHVKRDDVTNEVTGTGIHGWRCCYCLHGYQRYGNR
jgi:hypothetical protein